MSADPLWLLEETLWTSGRDAARALAVPGTMSILPYPAGILQGSAALTHPQTDTGWRSIEMADRTVRHRGKVAQLAYSVTAEKPGVAIYRALCASTWVKDGDTWQRLSHQQTPVA